MPHPIDALGEPLKNLMETIKRDPDIQELDQYRKVFRKHIPFWMRAYVAAYLIRQMNREGRLNAPTGGQADPTAPRTSTKNLKDPVSLFFGAGRSRRINAKEIVRILVEQAGVSRDAIGDIKVLENYSFIDVQKDAAPVVIQKLEGFTLRGRPVKLNYAKKKDEAPPPQVQQRKKVDDPSQV